MPKRKPLIRHSLVPIIGEYKAKMKDRDQALSQLGGRELDREISVPCATRLHKEHDIKIAIGKRSGGRSQSYISVQTVCTLWFTKAVVHPGCTRKARMHNSVAHTDEIDTPPGR